MNPEQPKDEILSHLQRACDSIKDLREFYLRLEATPEHLTRIKELDDEILTFESLIARRKRMATKSALRRFEKTPEVLPTSYRMERPIDAEADTPREVRVLQPNDHLTPARGPILASKVG
jgi:hypothetical protein